jgi:hypothetical protein
MPSDTLIIDRSGPPVSESLPVKSDTETRPAVPEVEFALVLSRLIESAQSDPIQLRSSIYQIARIKLQEQIASESPAEAQRLLQALETAITGVEEFSQRQAVSPLAALPHGESARSSARPSLQRPEPKLATIDHDAGKDEKDRRGAFAGFGRLSFVAKSIGLLAATAAIAYFAVEQRRHFAGTAGEKEISQPAQAKGTVPFGDKWGAIGTPEPAAAKDGTAPRQLLPDHFGVFAVSANRLHELEQLPGRAPDLRVAISAAIAQPAKTTIADGQVRFIVYRRDSATSAAERAEVRVMARLASAKSMPPQEGDSWVMRNITHPLRAAPIKDAADMYELRSDDPELVLTAGRYALVIKGAAYDFAVDGVVTDPKQCLERFQASNGVFYVECRKP